MSVVRPSWERSFTFQPAILLCTMESNSSNICFIGFVEKQREAKVFGFGGGKIEVENILDNL